MTDTLIICLTIITTITYTALGLFILRQQRLIERLTGRIMSRSELEYVNTVRQNNPPSQEMKIPEVELTEEDIQRFNQESNIVGSILS